MGYRLLFQNKIVFLSLKIVFVLANSVAPDEMPHSKAFHLGPHCLGQCHSTHLGNIVQCTKGYGVHKFAVNTVYIFILLSINLPFSCSKVANL